MNCAVCRRPLFEGATSCIVCGAPIGPAAAPPLAHSPSGVVTRDAPDAFSTAPTGLAVRESPTRHDTEPHPTPPYGPPPQHFASNPQQAPPAPANPIAIVSLIAGGAGFMPPVWFGSALCITAIATGVIGILRTSDRSGRRGRWFAIIGMALGFSFLPIQACFYYMRH